MQKFIVSSLVSLLTVLLAPIIVPIKYLVKQSKQSRIHKEVSHRSCSICGNYLGIDSMARATQQFKNRVQEFRNKYPTMIINFGRPFAAICTHCDCHYDYDPVEKIIIPKPSTA